MTSSELQYTQEALALAQRVVYELSGRRVVWPALTTTEIFDLPRRSSAILRLSGTPIQTIDSVKVVSADGVDIQTVDFAKVNASRVRVNTRGISSVGSNPISCDNGRQLEITYSYGARPPADLEAGIIELAEEYTRLLADEAPINSGCSLPPGVKSVNSRGINLSMEEEDTRVSEGKTGIDSLDSAIMRYNSLGARSRSRLYSPTFPPTRRTNTHTRV